MIYNIYVGVDPSINSTGVTILVYEEENLIDEKFFIIKPDKLTKKESDAETKYIDKFQYIIYEKLVNEEKDDNHKTEVYKTLNFIHILDNLKKILQKYRLKYDGNTVFYVCQEGISYGSIKKTKSIFDLAGLNYMLRMCILTMKTEDINLIIATPGEIKKFASGNGNANKDVMIALFKASHIDFELPKLDDISDSYWMAKYAKKLNS